ncbi:MAG TPA: hypothetical protein VH817_02065 [Thermoleophilaceae bacterium]
MRLSGKLTLASGEEASLQGCHIEALFGQKTSGAPSTARAFSDAAGDFTLEGLDRNDIASDTVKFVALSPTGRFIGETEIPTADLGNGIRIGVEGLEQPSANSAPAEPEPETEMPTSTAVRTAFRDDAAFRHALTENLKPLRAQSEAIATRVDTAFANFKPTPLSTEELAARHYIKPGKDPREALDKVIADGVEALRSAETTRTLTLRKSEKLSSLMEEAADNGDASDHVGLGALVNFINEKNAGGSLVTEPVYTACKAKLDAEGIVAALEKGPAPGNGDGAARNGDGDGDGGGGGEAAREADELVKDSVNLQMHSATAPESRLEYGSMPAIPNTADKDKVQSSIVQTFELRPGASDVTSYHDFHTLQIAFQHVWSRIFDEQLESLGRDLYREYVKLKDFSGSANKDLNVGTVDDLRRLMDEVKRLSQTVQQDIPPDLRGNGGVPASSGTKDSDDLNNAVKAGLGLASGGATWLLEWALDAFSKAGKKPIIRWADFPGPWPPRQDKIDVSFANDAVPTGNVEIVLKTDYGSHIKILEFEPWEPETKQFVHGPQISNTGHPEGATATMALRTSQIGAGVIEFASEETPGLNLGRYVLGDLTEKLKDGTRVTFHWRDN